MSGSTRVSRVFNVAMASLFKSNVEGWLVLRK